MRIFFSLLTISLFSFQSIGQYDFVRNRYIPVYKDGEPLKSPWAGGINSGQFSKVDLNNDGFMDLFVFDRIGNRILTFINTDATPGVISYEHRFEYVANFPDTLVNWAILKDFNCDGKSDLFSSKSSGVRLYRNISEGDNLEFEMFLEPIFASYNLSGTPFNAPLYNLTIDLPSIIDYEGDGDLDIVTWNENATTVYYFHNTAVENGNCDTVIFEMGNRCYGQFAESSESFALELNDDFQCDFNAIDPIHLQELPTPERSIHAGGMIFQIDLDQNGKQDLILSDIADDYMKALFLVEDSEGLDSTTTYIDYFPTNYTDDQIIEYETFPAGFYEDIDNDGVKDLVSSPNGIFACRDYNSVWLYKNTGEVDLPYFDFIEEDFLQKDMIDVGRSAYPIVLDYNSDGLMDILIANDENFFDSDSRPCKFTLMKNVGTLDFPEFSIVNDNYLDLEGQEIGRAYPAFGDLDNDTDLDMILGLQDGTFMYFRNDADLGEEPDFVLVDSPLLDFEGEDLDVGQVATPQLFDIDDNGTLDIVVGEKNGNINLIRNTGSPEVYEFTHEIDSIGSVVASNFLGIEGHSVPFLWRNEEGEIEMLVGSEVGEINHYNDIEGNLEGEFNLVEERLGGIKEGTYAGAALVDFTNDGIRDLIYGQIGGGLAFYQGGDSITIGVENLEFNDQINIYPNPSHGEFVIEIDRFNSQGKIEVYNQMGQLIYAQQNINPINRISTSTWSNGLYLVSYFESGKRSIEKLIVENK